MCKGTKFQILAGLSIRFKVGGAELGLVLVRVVKLFHTVVRSVAHITPLTGCAFACHLRADFRLVSTQGSPSVFIIIMVEWAALQVVILRILLTLLNLECKQVQEHDCLLHADITRVVPSTVIFDSIAW